MSTSLLQIRRLEPRFVCQMLKGCKFEVNQFNQMILHDCNVKSEINEYQLSLKCGLLVWFWQTGMIIMRVPYLQHTPLINEGISYTSLQLLKNCIFGIHFLTAMLRGEGRGEWSIQFMKTTSPVHPLNNLLWWSPNIADSADSRQEENSNTLTRAALPGKFNDRWIHCCGEFINVW